MTEAVFYEDSYLKEIDATITEVEGATVRLDKSIFYPLGGGQPGDTGWLEDESGQRWAIIDSRKGTSHGVILHQLESDNHGLEPGQQVRIGIDWDGDQNIKEHSFFDGPHVELIKP